VYSTPQATTTQYSTFFPYDFMMVQPTQTT
jgi:hypothetical protein